MTKLERSLVIPTYLSTRTPPDPTPGVALPWKRAGDVRNDRLATHHGSARGCKTIALFHTRAQTGKKPSAFQRLAQQLIDQSGVGAAAGGLHDLPDEKPEHLPLARPPSPGLRRAGGHHLRHGGLGLCGGAELAEPVLLDDVLGLGALLDHLREDLCAGARRDGAVGDELR